MTKTSQISAGQLTALLLTSRLAVSMTFAPTLHQVSHGSDYLLSAVLHGVLLLLAALPGPVVRQTDRLRQPAGIRLYPVGEGRRGGGRGLRLAALLYQLMDMVRFSQFVSTTLTPDISRTVLCITLAAAAYAAAFYGPAGGGPGRLSGFLRGGAGHRLYGNRAASGHGADPLSAFSV